MQRYFLANGQVTDRVDTYQNPNVLSPDAQAIAEVAAALGIAVDQVSVQHAPAAPPVQLTIPAAMAVVRTPSPLHAALVALAADPALSSVTKAAIAQAVTMTQIT